MSCLHRIQLLIIFSSPRMGRGENIFISDDYVCQDTVQLLVRITTSLSTPDSAPQTSPARPRI
jgi:hypothetical protein